MKFQHNTHKRRRGAHVWPSQLSRTGARRRGGGSMTAAALMADFVDSSRTEAKRRGGGSMPAAVPVFHFLNARGQGLSAAAMGT